MPVRYPDLYDEAGQYAPHLALYCAVCFLLHQQFPLADASALVAVPDDPIPPDPGPIIPVDVRVPPENFATSGLPSPTRSLVLSVFGGMLLANMDDPALGRPPEARGPNDIVIDAGVDPVLRVRIVPRFVEAFSRAVQTYTVNQLLFAKVLRYLEEVGEAADGRPGEDARSEVFTKQLARVVQRLLEQGVSPDAPQLRLQIANCVDATSLSPAGLDGGRYGDILDLDLPDLDGELPE